MTVETKKLDELFRQLPKNTGIDPRLIEDATTELNVLKFRAGAQPNVKEKTWTKTDLEKLQDKIKEKDTEILILKRQLQYRQKPGQTGGLDNPTKIQTHYNDLYNDEWAVVYNYFKSCGWTDIETIITLQRILRASFAFCKDVCKEQLQNIEGEALYPSASWMDDDGIISRMHHTSISGEITDLAKMYQRTTANECLSALQKTFAEQILPTFVDPSEFNESTVEEYANHCVEITWAMCVQDPPMAFINKIERGADFDYEQFQKYTNSGNDKFDFLVWPALLLHEDGPLLVKGIAQPIGALPTANTNSRTKSRDSRFTLTSRHTVDEQSTARTSGTAPPQSSQYVRYQQTPAGNENKNPSTPYFNPGPSTVRSAQSAPYRAGPISESVRSAKTEAGQRDDTDMTIVWRKGPDGPPLTSR